MIRSSIRDVHNFLNRQFLRDLCPVQMTYGRIDGRRPALP